MARLIDYRDTPVRAVMEHQLTETWYVIRAKKRGVVEQIAQIHVRYPPRGHGERPLRVLVRDFGEEGTKIYFGKAGGYGYDKVTAALAGAAVGGWELGDHCDHKGRPHLRTLCVREGWTLLRQ